MNDKIIFWIDAAILHFCLAYIFQQKYGNSPYAIIDITTKPRLFFENQHFVKFQKVWYFHDYIKKLNKKPDLEYLSSVEEKYKINFSKLTVNERHFYRFNDFYNFSSNEILLILEQECKLFEKILDEVKPNFFITQLTALHHHHLFYEMCRARNVKVLMLYMSKFGHRCVISQEVNKLDFPEDLSKVPCNNRIFEELQNNFKSYNIVKQIENYKKKVGSSKIKKIEAAKSFLFDTNYITNQTHYTYYGRNKMRVLLHEINSFLKIKKRKSFIDKHLLRELNFDEKFVVYPLHIEQERNLLIAVPYMTNQIELIRTIVKSLPVGYKLYVKEHPAQATREWRSISEYNEIIKIPNVRLFHPSVSTEQILNNCDLVITIGGTTGLEAAFFKKPSIILSEMDYSILPSVEYVKDLTHLLHAIKSSLKKTVNPDDLDRFTNLYEKNSFYFDFLEFQTKYHEYFYYGGNLLDAKISISKMELFLNENELILTKVAEEHIKKINLLNQLNN
jgi:hypothetical protein